MNKIEELIEELCPQGVEFKALGEVATLQRGTSITKKKVNKGIVPVIAGGQKPAYYHNENNREGETIVVAGSGAYAGFVTYWTCPVFVSDAFSIIPDNDVLNTKYTYYFLKNLQQDLHELKSGGGVPHVYVKNVSPIQIPIPPLAIQKEIVKILDNFTRLEAELEAELEARKKQYEHYREELLTFEDDVEWTKLGDVCEFTQGIQIPQSEQVREFRKGYKRYIYISDLLHDEKLIYVKDEYIEKEVSDKDLIMVNTGNTSGKIFWGKAGVLSNNVFKISFGNNINSKYLYYYLSSDAFYKKLMAYFKKGSQPHLGHKIISGQRIKIPDISKQKEIVAILDKFDALVNDISTGLPAEITARKKQYEYYRNQLLTFKPLELQDAN